MCLCDHACVVDPAHRVPPCQESYELQLSPSLPWQLKPLSFASSQDSLRDTRQVSGMPENGAKSQVESEPDP